MCGICGIYLNKGASDISNIDKKNIRTSDFQKLKAVIEKMNQIQSRRGPDDEGIFISINQPLNQHKSASVALGHRRLSILDLSKAGHQPMAWKNQDNTESWITYNGEIYNFLELKKDLEKKDYKFKTQTDTEVILALYAEYGEESFSMLRGMFAFGLWDGGEQKLFLVKDRYGIKPLYYYADDGKIVFASTVKAISESGLIPVKKNSDAFIGFLLFGSVPLPMTTVKDILAVPAGHYLIREIDGSQKLVQYYDPLFYYQRKSANISVNQRLNDKNYSDEVVLKVRNLLAESVNLHLISDAPLGVFLSGGLDSSALAALAAKNVNPHKSAKIRINPRLVTLSIIFDEQEFSEERYSDLVAEKIGSEHHKIKITQKDFHDSFEEIFDAMDQPTVDGVNTFFIAKAAKEAGLKTVLSGLGSDEIFCGYSFFKKAEMIRRIQNLPQFLKFPLDLLPLFGDRYSKLSYFVNNDIPSFYLGIRGLFSPKEAAKILDINLSEVENFIKKLQIEQSQHLRKLEQLHPVNLLSCLELKFYLQNQLLKDTDFMSMRHSIEVRVPFLDHKLVEYVSSLPPETKLNPYQRKSDNISVNQREIPKTNKPLLVAAVNDILPPDVYARPKMGFTFPFQKWLEKEPLLVKSHKSSVAASRHWSRFWANLVLTRF